MKRFVFPVVALFVGMVVASWVVAQESGDKAVPKHTLKEVMKQAHGSKLLNKVVDGKASKEEKDQLLDIYISLLDSDPPKGDKEAWIMNSGRLVVAAARVAVGRDGSTDELKAASNCKACHDSYK
jgi:cytochrome c556